MPLPSVSVNIQGGQLGRVAAQADNVAGLILSGVAIVDEVVLGTPFQITSLADAEAKGITAAYDTANSTNAHRQIADFYAEAGTGAELWVVILVNTTTLANSVPYIDDIRAASGGRVRLIGISRVPDGSYSPTITNGLDTDVAAAVAAAKTALLAEAANYTPVTACLIEGRGIDASALANLPDQRATSVGDGSKYVTVCLGDSVSGTGSMVGRWLGELASLPVQRAMGRVRNGALGITSCFIGTAALSSISDTVLSGLLDKGYLIPRRHTGLDGFYPARDANSDALASDFAFINRVRVIEKARLIVRAVLLQELLEEVEIDATTGKIAPAFIATLKSRCDNALALDLVNLGNASDAFVEIDPAQNVLSTDRLDVTVKVVPVGTLATITATVSYFNPA